MSNVSTRHAVTPFVSGESKPLSGQRLARVGYKKTKENPNPLQSVCASIPFVAVPSPEQITRLMPHIGNMLEAAQDGIFRSMYESSHGALRDITDDDISIDACISYLDAAAAGDRLSADAIKAWFAQNVADNLIVMIAEKLGYDELTEDNLATVQKHVRIYEDVACMLAGKSILAEKQRKSLRVALSLSPSQDAMHDRLIAKLDAMEKKKEADFLELL